MPNLLSPGQRAFVMTALMAMASSQVQSCSSDPGSSGPIISSNGGTVVTGTGGTGAGGDSGPSGGVAAGGPATGGSNAVGGGSNASGGSANMGGNSMSGGTMGTSAVTGGNSPGAGGSATGGNAATGGAPGDSYTVALIQSSKAQATDITQDDIKTMVTDAVTQAGGLDFIQDGMTVVLKPNLLTHLAACWSGTATLSPTVNGVTTDWRVTKAVADLVRAQNPSGKILVMEGSNRNTTSAFAALGYTSANFGTSVDEFIPLEGTSGCASRSQTGLIQKPGKSGQSYWINQRYFEADIVISLGALKTHGQAGITGCVRNLGIGSTPNAMYSVSTNNADCTRNMSQSTAASYIDHSFNGLGTFVSDFYSVRPPDFAVMDALQGLQNGPCSTNASDRKNMRLILASRNAVALDTVQAAVMNCTGSKLPYLTRLEGWGLGTTDLTKITVVGNKQIADVRLSFTGAGGGVCN